MISGNKDNIRDGFEPEMDDVSGVILGDKVNEEEEEHPMEATTMIAEESTIAAKAENQEISAVETNAGKTDEKCTIEVFSSELVGRPPPDYYYSLTSPCLPPNSPREQDWPPEPPPPFDGHPPYPAGPPLLKVAYPKDIPGPTYACPKCDGRFLYHRPAGVVQCPFCHSAISIGHYIRIRAWSLIMFALLVLSSSLTFAMANVVFLDSSRPYFIAIGMMAALGLSVLFRAVQMCYRYRETERIEFT